MEADFWHRKWASNEIGFHESEVNPLLVRHLPALAPAPGSRIFLPLCGKTLDIHWLLSGGFRVVGVELSGLAVDQLFAELGIAAAVERSGPFERRSGPGIDVFVGDFFALDAATLGPVDAVYDRAALVALPAERRPHYAATLAAITGGAPQLLIGFEYDQVLMSGPPFAVGGDEVARLYGRIHSVRRLETAEIPGGFKGRIPASESVWLLGR